MAATLVAMAALCAPALSRAAPLDAYGRLPTIEHAQLSADGQYVAISVTDGEKRTVAIQRASDLQTVAAIRVGDTKLRALQWAGPNHVLMTIEVTKPMEGDVVFGGSHHWGVIDYNLTTHKQAVLMANVRYALNTVYGPPEVRLIDGHPFAFVTTVSFSDEGGGGGMTLFRIDLDRGLTTVAERGGQHVSDFQIDGRGQVIAETTYDAPTSQWSLRLRAGADWRTLQTETAPLEHPGLAGLGRDGRSILVADHIGDEPVLRELAPDATAWPEPFYKGRAGLIADPGAGTLVGLVHLDGDTLSYDFFDVADRVGWEAANATFAGQPVSLISAAENRRKFIVRVDSPTNGPAFALVDLSAATARWIGGEYETLQPADIAQQKPITFKAADGLDLTGYLTIPHGKAPEKLPLAVLVHGGPAARDEPGFDWWAQALASRGYAVLQVNYRGSQGFGWSFLSAGFGQWGRKMQTDVSDGVRYLAAQGIIDPKRVCIVGASYGGYAALAGATLDHGVYRCAASVSGPADLKRMIVQWKYREGRQGVESERYWLRFMGADGVSDPQLQAISPASLADKADIPILLVHGTDDQVVPFEQSQIMADALKRAGKPFSFVTLKSEDHYLSRGETRLQMLQAVVDFLEKNNPPG